MQKLLSQDQSIAAKLEKYSVLEKISFPRRNLIERISADVPKYLQTHYKPLKCEKRKADVCTYMYYMYIICCM